LASTNVDFSVLRGKLNSTKPRPVVPGGMVCLAQLPPLPLGRDQIRLKVLPFSSATRFA
jgi:hypothetical protein